MVRDMLGMMTKVAKVRAQQGQLIEAVELLATVLVEPTGFHRPFTNITPINEVASAALADLEEVLDPEEYSSAFARGAERHYDVVAKQLLDNAAYSDRDSSPR